MSTKTQNLKRKQKGEFKNIENLEVSKKVFVGENETKVVPKNKKEGQFKDNNHKKAEKFEKKSFKKFKNTKIIVVPQEEVKEDQKGELENSQGNIQLSQINRLAEKLWNKSTNDTDKQKHITQIITKMEKVLQLLVQKRQGSRAIQACIKHGTEEQRTKVFEIVLRNDFIETVKSKYGHFLALRMIKFMKDAKSKAKFCEQLLKNAFYLVSHVEGAKVIDQYMRNLAKPSELTAFKKVFDDVVVKQQNLKDGEKFEGIDNLALKIVDKANHYPLISKYILQIALPILIPAEREKIVDFLREKIMDLIEDKEGVKLCLDVINYSGAKERKTIVKNMKDNILKMIKSQSQIAFLVVQKLIHALDDTVLVGKQILNPLKPELAEILENKHGMAIISSIFIPQHNALKTMEKEVKFTTSKKDDTARLEQLQGYIAKDIIEIIKQWDEEKLLKSFGNSRFVSAILKYILKQNISDQFSFVQTIINKFLDENQLKEANFEKSLLNNIDSHRVAKYLISLSGELLGEAKNMIDEFLEKMSEIVSNNAELFIQNKSSIYIVIALIEQTSFKEIIIQNVQSLPLQQIATKKTEGKDMVGFNILKKFL